jgi:hypothetical protein
MQFDPAIAAQLSFRQAQASGELGSDLNEALSAEETFSGSAGPEAAAAYFALQEIGARHPDAVSLQEFLIYITWQQVTEQTIPEHFQRGAALCDAYLERFGGKPSQQAEQIRELRRSFHAGLGINKDDDMDYDADAFKGGD